MFLFISTFQHQNRSYFPLYNCLKYQHFRSLCKMTNPADLPVGPREGPIDPQVTTHRYQPRVCRYPRVPPMSLGVPPVGLWVPADLQVWVPPTGLWVPVGTIYGSAGTTPGSAVYFQATGPTRGPADKSVGLNLLNR